MSRSRNMVSALLRLAGAWLAAGAVEAVVFFEWGGGHADVPFTTFPDYLAIAPLVPVIVAGGLGSPPRALFAVSTAVFVVVLAAAWFALGRVRRRGTPIASD